MGTPDHQHPLSQRITRRAAVKSSIFGLLAISLPRLAYAKQAVRIPAESPPLSHRYPSIDDGIVAEVVGASHFDLARVKELVGRRPELARATWDWAFGDWETALGAASHVGRRDIAEYLMAHGARPDIFTYAMLGSHAAVRAMIEATPGIHRISGPHGISLLQHVKAGLRSEGITTQQRAGNEALIAYLEGLGDADTHATDLEVSAAEKEKFIGDYMYGDGPTDGLSVKLNMRKIISLGRLGTFGGALYQRAPNVFIYNGTTSIEITFEVVAD
ncbi:MAG: hypothetical protein ABI432_09765, partial [Flavobacteriales bacterium]